MQDYFKQAKNYFNNNYKQIMNLFSMIYAQLECEERSCTNLQLVAKASYYTVVSHMYLNNHPILSLLDGYIKQNKETNFDLFDKELAVCILLESKLHDLEVEELVSIRKDKQGNNSVSLTEKGRKVRENQIKNVNEDLLGL